MRAGELHFIPQKGERNFRKMRGKERACGGKKMDKLKKGPERGFEQGGAPTRATDEGFLESLFQLVTIVSPFKNSS